MSQLGYKKIILDCYWNPGSDNAHPEMFTPMFRVNMFFYGYSPTSQCHNGFNPLERFQMGIPESIDEYCQKVYAVLQQAKAQGAVALKSALPYDRGLNLFDCDKAVADKAFLRCLREQGDSEDIERFQGYMLNRLCEMAAQLDLPFQMHTGMGKLVHSNAMWLQPAIENHPDTQFMLLHGGYPWCDDTLALAHHYRNVNPDICWMPVLSTSVAERFLDDLLEAGRSDGICWGCDTWTVEESLGSLLAAREVVARVLSAKIAAGRIDMDAAVQTAQAIFYDNAHRLYFEN
jgi:predicted TIM-barrel fold metal-dependent hydrolase